MNTRHDTGEEIDFVEAPYTKVIKRGKVSFYSTTDMSHQEWLQFRQNGIGGSEVGTVLMLNPWCSRLQLYEQKIGLIHYEPEENAAMFWGKELEEQVAEKWQYYDGTVEGMMKNYRDGKIIRKCSRVNAFAINEDYPWLFSSIDRRINKNQASPFTAVLHEKAGILEAKNISGWASAKWEAGIPPYQVVQLQSYLMVYDLDYGELAILKDGRVYEVIPFERNEAICQGIVEETRQFWARVVEGRRLLAEKAAAETMGNYEMARGFQMQLDMNEPEPDGTEAYAAYLKEKYRNPIDNVIKGGLEELRLARKLEQLRAEEKACKALQLTCSNPLIHFIANNTTIDFGEHGKVTYQPDKNGKRSLKLSLNSN